jgi:hypothetical protein
MFAFNLFFVLFLAFAALCSSLAKARGKQGSKPFLILSFHFSIGLAVLYKGCLLLLLCKIKIKKLI